MDKDIEYFKNLNNSIIDELKEDKNCIMNNIAESDMSKEADDYHYQIMKEVKDVVDSCVNKISHNLTNYYPLEDYYKVTTVLNNYISKLCNILSSLIFLHFLYLLLMFSISFFAFSFFIAFAVCNIYENDYLPYINALDDLDSSQIEQIAYNKKRCEEAKKSMLLWVNHIRILSNKY